MGKSVDFWVIVKYPNYTASKISNKAYLLDSMDYCSSTYRTVDYDYIQMDRHKVSLEKFVSEVTDKDGQNKVTYDRSGHRFNEFDKDDTSKIDKPVELEIGDKVTYTIRLTNTGDLPVRVDQIYDIFENNENKIKLIQDESDEAYGIKLKTKTGEIIDNFGTITEKFKDDIIVSEDSLENTTGNQIGNLTGNLTGNNTVNNTTSELYSNINKYLIDFNESNKNVVLQGGESIDVLIRFTISVPIRLRGESQRLVNKAEIVSISDENGNPVDDSDGTVNNIDEDHVITKTYAVSLEKFVSKLNNKPIVNNRAAILPKENYDFNEDGVIDKIDSVLMQMYLGQKIDNDLGIKVELTEKIINRIKTYGDVDNDGSISVMDATEINMRIIREGRAEHKYDEDTNTNDNWKYNNVVTVSTGDIVTYTIRVKNDGETGVYISSIKDYMPNGLKYGEIIVDRNNNEFKFTNLKDVFLKAGEEARFTIDVEVVEPNISLNILQNKATINFIRNRNNILVEDTTPNDNTDSDYIQLDYEEKEETTDYTVIKQWSGNLDQRPAQVSVKLFKVENGKEIDLGMESVVLSDANNWTYTWKELPKGTDYIARELSESGDIVKGNTKYNNNITTSYSENANTMTITNNFEGTPPPPPHQDKTEFTVEKIWDDNNNPDRPSSVTVKLYKVVGTESKQVGNAIKLDSNSWTHKWTDLTKYDTDGNVIRYFAMEEVPSNYKANYLHEQDKTTITNKIIEEPEEDNDDLTISGIVWNDLALNKTQNNYDGLKDAEEKGLSGVKVMLYRVGKGIISTTYTNEYGEYSFTNENLIPNLPEKEKLIKGPIDANSNRWSGTYYSYYVMFEYDGITYTSTKFAEITSNNSLDSNAKEDIGLVEQKRTEFNNKFTVINKNGAYTKAGTKTCELEYSTSNEKGYIPQSTHKYDENNMKMQSSTKLINLSEYSQSEDLLKHVNLGLRGRDTFDLELTSDVYSTKVTVNKINGEYNYNSNKVTVRREDISRGYNYREDSANPYLQSSKYEGQNYEQNIRATDIKNDVYGDTGLKIEVTYKITVTNTSQTEGTATKVINYYDDVYTFVKAYVGNNELSVEDGNSGQEYKSVVITTPGTNLIQSATMDIYVVYELKDATRVLKDIDSLATYNMAEIAEYKTKATNGNEATRGLIDKDSAPGSVNTEKVRLHPDLIGNQSTVDYYFGGNDLSILKYEDDTYATPTLYFVSDSSQRTIAGKVFRDETAVDENTRIKTGNGKIDDGEVGVYGATVELIEQVEGGKVRYTTSTNDNGEYTFTGFLPGNYIVKYHYGDTEKTVLKHQAKEGINRYSFNGEDYQATNNAYDVTVRDDKGNEVKSNILNKTENYWYIYNENDGISTGTDNKERRKEVSKNVVKFTVEQMTELNNIRLGTNNNDIKTSINAEGGLISKTKMNAVTPNMLFGVEEKVLDADKIKDQTNFGEYNVSNMNFGLAEVPVTTIELKKEVAEFTITDSTGENILAKAGKGVEVQRDVISTGNDYTAEIEDAKLQGAKLQITYKISSETVVQSNFDKTASPKATIEGLMDIVDNNLSYNPELNGNKEYWEVLNENKIVLNDKLDFDMDGNISIFDANILQYYEAGTLTDKEKINKVKLYGDIDGNGVLELGLDENGKPRPDQRLFQEYVGKMKIISSLENINTYSTVVEATTKALDDINKGHEITITLEQVLSSTDATISDIITSNKEILDPYVYDNIIEITKLDYTNVTSGEITSEDDCNKDRIRTSSSSYNYTVLAGKQFDTAAAGTISIIPPWGGLNYVPYYIIAVISLGVLVAGVFGVRKVVLSKKK